MRKGVERLDRSLGGVRVIPILVLLQALAVYSIWTLGAVNQGNDKLYGLYLSIDLVSFALVSYMYRVEEVNPVLLLEGLLTVFLAILLIVVGVP